MNHDARPESLPPSEEQEQEQSHRVLVVEDALNWCGFYRAMLERRGFVLKMAHTYVDAVNLLRNESFEVAIIDLELHSEVRPKNLDGIFLLEWLIVKRIPAIIVTAYAIPNLVNEIYRQYAHVYRIFDKVSLDRATFPQEVLQAANSRFPDVEDDQTRREEIRREFEKLIEYVLGRAATPQEASGIKETAKKHRASLATITWLHVSDLHFRTPPTHDAKVVLQSLLKDIEKQMKDKSLRADLIAVTGDIAFSGKSNEYDLAKHFLDNLLRVTGLTKDRLFVIPGNHDVDRALISLGAQLVSNGLKSRRRTVDILSDEEDRQFLFRRFQGYAAFIGAYFEGHLVFDDEHYFYTRQLEMKGKNIAILGLNSAWICSSDKDERRKMIVGEPQAWAALEQAENADLRLAMLHHPFDWLRDFERKDVEPMLCRGCDFVLHGHLHDTSFLHLRNPDAEAIVIAAGACYETRAAANSYNLVQLDYATGRGKIILRKWSGRFWTVDATTYQNIPNGEYEFDLPPLPPG